ncbi:MAG: hypothetical protein HKN79_12465 [Flavobacteriales bacterium]|nr:hypothetical protein [Flavobacteriales bacterium]
MLLIAASLPESPVRVMTSVMTYNIHLESSSEQARPWDERKAMVAQVIHSRSPEILGLQGATLGQTEWLEEKLKDYASYAPTSQSLVMGTDMCPILYSRSIYESVDEGTFLIGEAIEKTESGQASDNQMQFLNWVKLRHMASEKELYVLNTRIDLDAGHDKFAITERLKDIITELVDGETFMLLADMAHSPESAIIRSISEWAKDSEENSLVSISDMEATQPGWVKRKDHSGERVDYIFLSFDIPANSYEVLDIDHEGEYPSDHLPVYCRLRIQ